MEAEVEAEVKAEVEVEVEVEVEAEVSEIEVEVDAEAFPSVPLSSWEGPSQPEGARSWSPLSPKASLFISVQQVSRAETHFISPFQREGDGAN